MKTAIEQARQALEWARANAAQSRHNCESGEIAVQIIQDYIDELTRDTWQTQSQSQKQPSN